MLDVPDGHQAVADGARGMAVNQAAVSSNNTYFCLITVKMLPKDLTEDTMLFKINTSANIALILTLLRKMGWERNTM